MSSKPNFIGVTAKYPCANGQTIERLHLDGAASPLAAQTAVATIEKLLPHYSNTHSYVHNSAQISSKAYAWAHTTVLEYLNADVQDYVAIFSGSGTTSAINRLARGLSAARPERKLVLVSSMEHHANDLPHRQFGNEVIYLPLNNAGAQSGTIDLTELSSVCQSRSGEINYIAVSSVSNVTGVRNPINEICSIAHQHDILVLVDGAQSVAHGPTDLSQAGADFFVFSGHKLYTPFGPGVLVAKKSLLKNLSGQDLGGGSVDSVTPYDYHLVDHPSDREESGTPNLVGAIALAAVLKELMSFGLDAIEAHDQSLMSTLKAELEKLDKVTVYADRDLARTGAIAFNLQGVDHGLAAAILNDYYGIAIRNECFCAHPYVSSLLKEELWQLNLDDIDEDAQEAYINRKRGMLRASISLYNSEADVRRLISALIEIAGPKLTEYEDKYIAHDDGSYTHVEFRIDWKSILDL